MLNLGAKCANWRKMCNLKEAKNKNGKIRNEIKIELIEFSFVKKKLIYSYLTYLSNKIFILFYRLHFIRLQLFII